MKTYKPKTTVSKGAVETLTVAIAVALSTKIPALADYQEASIIVIAATIKMLLNVIKHKFGIDLSKLAGK